MSISNKKNIDDWNVLSRLVSALALIVALFFCLGMVYNNYSAEEQKKIIRNEGVNAVSSMIRSRLLEFDYSGVQSVAEAYMEREYIENIIVTDKYDYVVYGDIEKNTQLKNDHYFSIDRHILIDTDNNVGMVSIVFSKQQPYDFFIKTILLTITLFLSVFGSCRVAFKYYTSRYVTGPINSVSTAMEATLVTGKHVEVDYQSNTSLGLLANRFNLMQQELEHTRAKKSLLIHQKDEISKSLNKTLIQQKKSEEERISLLSALGEVLSSSDQTIAIYDHNNARKFINSDKNLSYSIQHYVNNPLFSLNESIAYFEKNNVDAYLVLDNEDQDQGMRFTLDLTDGVKGVWLLRVMRDKNGDNILLVSNITELRLIQKKHTHTQKMEALGKLVGGVAHEFNNMLSIIHGNMDLLKYSKVDKAGFTNIVRSTNKATERAIKTVEQLLIYSRDSNISALPVKLSTQLSDLSNLVSQILGPHIKMSIDCRTHGLINVNPGAFDSAMVNLVTNARDAVKKQGEIRIIARDIEKKEANSVGLSCDNDYLVIEVFDSGVGINQDILDKIFDPFFTTKKIGQGVGLGLSAVYGFINQAGGIITCQSEPNAGSQFSLFFPKLTDNHDFDSVNDGPEQVTSLTSSCSLRCLVVDDELMLLNIWEKFLALSGCEVITASSAKEAKYILQSECSNMFDIVYCDVHIPDGKGVDILSLANTLHPSTKKVLMSGNITDISVPDWIDNVLEKPFSANKMLDLLPENTHEHV